MVLITKVQYNYSNTVKPALRERPLNMKSESETRTRFNYQFFFFACSEKINTPESFRNVTVMFFEGGTPSPGRKVIKLLTCDNMFPSLRHFARSLGTMTFAYTLLLRTSRSRSHVLFT